MHARARLAANTHARRIQLGARDPSLLAGTLFDDKGNRLTPTHTTGKASAIATMRSNQQTAERAADLMTQGAAGAFLPPKLKTSLSIA